MPNLKTGNVARMLMSSGLRSMRFIERFQQGWASPSDDVLRAVRRFLFLEYGTALGVNIHATPIFEALKLVVPDAVTMVACAKTGYEVFKHNPFIDYLIETPRPVEGVLEAVRCLRAGITDTGFAPQMVITSKGNEQRSMGLLAFLAARAIRLGYTGTPELFDIILQPDIRRSLIDNQMRIIERLGYEKQNLEPRLFYTRADLEKVEALFRNNGIANSAPRIVCITQTSRTQRRGWPMEQLISVLDHARSHYDAHIIFVGTSSESQEIEHIRAQVRGTTVSLVGQTTIQMMAALLASSDLALTLDTGNMHIGRTTGIPMVILAPAWAPSVEWLPMKLNQCQVFLGNLDPYSPPHCEIIQMDTLKVIESMDYLLTAYPPSEFARRDRAERSISSIRN